MFDQSGIGLPSRKSVRIAYFVADSAGSVMSLRDSMGNQIKNEFADEQSALEMAVQMAEADEKWGIRSRSLYVVHKGIIRNGVAA